MISIIQAAGWPIWPLVITSIVALALITERALSLRQSRCAPEEAVQVAIDVLSSERSAKDTLDELARQSLMGHILSQGVRAYRVDAHLSEAGLRLALENAGKETAQELERYMNALATIATVAPLMGLLGTVVGMIELFGAHSPSGVAVNPQQLAHGISIALYNTAAGLLIAIPVLMFHRFFRSRVEAHRLSMEIGSERFVALWLQVTRQAT